MTASVTASIGNSIALSPSERKVLNLLAPGRETTTKALAERYYRPQEVPFNGQIVITNVVRNLSKKTAHKNCPFVVKRGIRKGPHPMTVKLEAK